MPGGRPVEAEDLLRIQVLSDPQVSPDGQLVAFVVTTLDQEHDRTVSRIWLVPVAGGDASAADARWRPCRRPTLVARWLLPGLPFRPGRGEEPALVPAATRG
jgi:dipeptidyl aminopeptidase/acylaminoacyl peptidase